MKEKTKYLKIVLKHRLTVHITGGWQIMLFLDVSELLFYEFTEDLWLWLSGQGWVCMKIYATRAKTIPKLRKPKWVNTLWDELYLIVLRNNNPSKKHFRPWTHFLKENKYQLSVVDTALTLFDPQCYNPILLSTRTVQGFEKWVMFLFHPTEASLRRACRCPL